MNPQLIMFVKYLVAGLFFFFGGWLVFTIIKGRNRDFKVQISKSQVGKRTGFSRGKGILLLVIILVMAVMWWMGN